MRGVARRVPDGQRRWRYFIPGASLTQRGERPRDNSSTISSIASDAPSKGLSSRVTFLLACELRLG